MLKEIKLRNGKRVTKFLDKLWHVMSKALKKQEQERAGLESHSRKHMPLRIIYLARDLW